MTVLLRHWTKKTKNSHNCKIWLRHEKRKILKILRGLVTREDQQQKRQNNKIIDFVTTFQNNLAVIKQQIVNFTNHEILTVPSFSTQFHSIQK